MTEPLVPGYRNPSKNTLDLAAQAKFEEERILRFIDKVAATPGVDQRWAAIARTGVEKSFMALVRSIFQPTRVGLPEDDGDQAA
jgi:hypothetical protein